MQPLISTNIHLLKQLRSCGLREEILATVFRSLVLSHVRYSSTVLVACPAGTKADIQVLQNCLLRAAGIIRDAARTKYKIEDVSDFTLRSCLEQVTGILAQPSHPLIMSLRSERTTHSAFPFTIPRPRKDAFTKNAVMITLVHLRDNVYGTGRSKASVSQTRTMPEAAPKPETAALAQNGKSCPSPACTRPGHLWVRLD
jgi:hypothetical protein